MPYCVAKDAKLSCGLASFAVRKGMFLLAKRHLSQGVRWNEEGLMLNGGCNALIVRRLCGIAENRVFAPNIFLAQKKRVVFTIVCWHFFACKGESTDVSATHPR